MSGRETFACFAYPPNELGYCGPADVAHTELASHAREFDGAWPYLQAIADAAGISDPLDEDVVRSYWVGGPLLDKVDPAELLSRLRSAFTGQVTGLLDDLPDRGARVGAPQFSRLRGLPLGAVPRPRPDDAAAGHAGLPDSLGHGRIRRRASTPRSSVVPLTFDAGALALGRSAGPNGCGGARTVTSLAPPPTPGETVSAHWDWVCGSLSRRGRRGPGRSGDTGDTRPGQRRQEPANAPCEESPLVARDVEVRAQRAPDIARVDAVLDGLHGGAPAEAVSTWSTSSDRATHRTELALDEYVEFRQPHVGPTYADDATASWHTRTGSSTPARDAPARRAASR